MDEIDGYTCECLDGYTAEGMSIETSTSKCKFETETSSIQPISRDPRIIHPTDDAENTTNPNTIPLTDNKEAECLGNCFQLFLKLY